MTKFEISIALEEKYKSFTVYIGSLTAVEFEQIKNEKWSAAQQLQHLILSTKPLNQALFLPAFIIKLIFGKANRPSKTFEELVAKYTIKLQNGGKATKRFIPELVTINQREILLNQLNLQVSKLNKHISNFSEFDLDTIILPHPLLGKITLREMLYFTIHHVEHHQKLIEEGLKN